MGTGPASVDGSGEQGISLREAVPTWAYIGLNSFGGPTGQIAVMHKVLVEQKRWISEERFLHALNYCMLLPGPEATQLATYVGWLMHRTAGGLVAGVLFILPGFVSILFLSVAYTSWRGVPAVDGLLFGLKAAVLAIIIEAVIRIGRKVLHNPAMVTIAAASFAAIFFFQVPFPVIIGAAALIGLLGDRLRPDLFEVLKPKTASKRSADPSPYATDLMDASHTRPTRTRAIRVLLIWLPLWLVPTAVLRWWLGPDDVFAAEALFFTKAAVVTFGGAYAVLAYIAQQAVDVYGWLAPGEMITGLGLAETTPGPLIQVVQFVGYMGAYRDPGELHPVTAGVIASILVTWVTFVPCFMWIFLGAPFMEHLRGKRSLTAALSTITAAVVGVVANLSVWFAVHTLFGRVDERTWYGARLLIPHWPSFDWAAATIAIVAGVTLFKLHWGVLRTLAVAVALSIGWTVLGG